MKIILAVALALFAGSAEAYICSYTKCATTPAGSSPDAGTCPSNPKACTKCICDGVDGGGNALWHCDESACSSSSSSASSASSAPPVSTNCGSTGYTTVSTYTVRPTGTKECKGYAGTPYNKNFTHPTTGAQCQCYTYGTYMGAANPCDGDTFVYECKNASASSSSSLNMTSCAPVAGAHSCGTGTTTSQAPAGGTPVAALANKKLACCLNGWGEPSQGPSSVKLDCIQSAPISTQSFDTYYNHPGGGDADAGLPFPNRLFFVDGAGNSVPGFYNSKGRRCSYLTGKKTVAAQFALFEKAIVDRKPPPDVSPECNYLVRTALETECPVNPHPSTGILWRATLSGVTRCAAAQTMNVHFEVRDLSDPNLTKRTILAIGSSIVPAGEFIEELKTRRVSSQMLFKKLGCPVTPGMVATTDVDGNPICSIKTEP